MNARTRSVSRPTEAAAEPYRSTLGKIRAARFWRYKVGPYWRQYRWVVVGGLALVALVLGFIGFSNTPEGEGRSWSDNLYRAINLFALSGGAQDSRTPWQLEVARVLAPVLVSYAALRTAFALFREHLQRLRVSIAFRNHVVVCGLGTQGGVLAASLHARGYRVVGIEPDLTAPGMARCRELEIPIFVGRATDPAILNHARLDRARSLVAVSGDDTTNLAVALTAGALAEHRPNGALPVFLHVSELGIAELLRAWRARGSVERNIRIEFFNTSDGGARSLLKDFPPFHEDVAITDTAPHVLIVGLSEVGENLVLHMARAILRRSGSERIHLTTVDSRADARIAALRVRYPRLDEACQVTACDLDPCSAEFKSGHFARGLTSRVTRAYVTLDREADALAAGLALVRHLPDIPIALMVRDRASEETLVRSLPAESGVSEGLRPYALLERALSPELVLRGTNESLARMAHEDYVRQSLERGDTVASNSSLVGWDELPESLKESNRRQADAIGSTLTRLGYSLTADPLITPEANELELPADVLEQVAEDEHDRWRADLQTGGWSWGPRKDPERKVHPSLVPWAELSDEEKEKNRNVIRALPRILMRAGLSHLPDEPQGSR